MWFIYTMEYYSAVEKTKLTPFTAAWMGLDSEMSEKHGYCMTSRTCKSKRYNRLGNITKKRQTHRHRE